MSNLDPLTNGSHWGPTNLPPGGLYAERSFLFGGYVLGMGFAAQFVVYVAVMRILWSRRKVNRTSRILMALCTVMCLVDLLTAISVYVSLDESFIENVNFPLGGALGYIGASTGLWFHLLTVACVYLGNVLCDFILLWRCHVIWKVGGLGTNNVANMVIIVPVLMLLASISIGIVTTVKAASPISFANPTVIHLESAYNSISIALNLLLTCLIIFRLKMYRKEVVRHLGAYESAVYTSISTIFIESAALWSLVSIPLLVTITIESPLSVVFAGITSPTQMMSSYFIIWRFAEGRAWSNEMMSSSSPQSELEFKRPDQDNYPSRGIVVSRYSEADEIRLEAIRTSTESPSSNGNNENPTTPTRPTVDNKKRVPRWDELC